MKRALPIVPLVLFFLFVNACGNESDVSVIVRDTLTAFSWTQTTTPAPTSMAIGKYFVSLLNVPLSGDVFPTSMAQLENTIGASYQVLDVGFPKRDDGSLVFQVKFRCICGEENIPCCRSEQMFVLLMKRMHAYKSDFVTSMPAEVREVKVVCYDHLVLFEEVTANWEDVKYFLNGDIDGYQFGTRVRRKSVP
jgi:hypothetical protein